MERDNIKAQMKKNEEVMQTRLENIKQEKEMVERKLWHSSLKIQTFFRMKLAQIQFKAMKS